MVLRINSLLSLDKHSYYTKLRYVGLMWSYFFIGTPILKIWVNQPIHSFLVGCLNPCLQGTNVWVGSPHPILKWYMARCVV